MRQTNLSLDELLAELKTPWSFHKRCLLINEVGEICRHGNKEAAKKAEVFLRQLLNSKNPKDRCIAFCCLAMTENLDKETCRKLEEFQAKPENEEVLEVAERSLLKYLEREKGIKTGIDYGN